MRIPTLCICLLLAKVAVAGSPVNDADFVRMEKLLEDLELRGVDGLRAPDVASTPEAPSGRPHLAMARSILSMLASLDSTAVVVSGEVLPSLSLARNLDHLGMKRWALSWYERAEAADRRGEYRDVLLEEKIRLSLALADSATLIAQARELLAMKEAPQHQALVAQALDLVGAASSGAVVLELAARAEALHPDPDPPLRLSLARLRQNEAQFEKALADYRALLRRPELMTDQEGCWAIRGLADCLYRIGEKNSAARAYALMRKHNVGLLSAWGSYQTAVLAAEAGRFDEAIRLFESICERERNTPWRESSCWRLIQCRQLKEIDTAMAELGRTVPMR